MRRKISFKGIRMIKLRTYSIPDLIISEGINQGKIKLEKRTEDNLHIIETYRVLIDFAQICDDFYMSGGLFEREVIKKELESELVELIKG